MTHGWTNPDRGPPPEQLAAFADGELDPGARDRVEAWLADHPEAGAEVESLRRLLDLFRAAAAPEPAPEAWASAQARLEAGLPAGSPPRPRRGRRPRRWAAGLCAAAAVLGLLLLARPWWPRAGPHDAVPGPEEEREPFPVATAQEVNIISMDVNDADALAVHPPVLGPVEFAAPADITVVHVEPLADGMRPRLEGEAVGMFVAAAEPPEEEPEP
jgi:hypothetical protein